jgi:hypothetical protein
MSGEGASFLGAWSGSTLSQNLFKSGFSFNAIFYWNYSGIHRNTIREYTKYIENIPAQLLHCALKKFDKLRGTSCKENLPSPLPRYLIIPDLAVIRT